MRNAKFWDRFLLMLKTSKITYTYAQNEKCGYFIRGHEKIEPRFWKATEAFASLQADVEKPLRVMAKTEAFGIGNISSECVCQTN